MLNRRNLLKLVPVGLLGSLFPAKNLFAEENEVKQNKSLTAIRNTFTFKLDNEKFLPLLKTAKDTLCREAYDEYVKIMEEKFNKDYKINQISFCFSQDVFKDKACNYEFAFGRSPVIHRFLMESGKWEYGSSGNIFNNPSGCKLPTEKEVKDLVDSLISGYILTNYRFDTDAWNPEIYVYLLKATGHEAIGVWILQHLSNATSYVQEYEPGLIIYKSFNN